MTVVSVPVSSAAPRLKISELLEKESIELIHSSDQFSGFYEFSTYPQSQTLKSLCQGTEISHASHVGCPVTNHTGGLGHTC